MKELIDCRYMSINRFRLEKGRNSEHSVFFITEGEIDFQINGHKERASKGMLLSFPNDVTFERKIVTHAEFYYFRYKNPDGHPLPVGKIEIEDQNRMTATAHMLLNLDQLEGHTELKNTVLADLFAQAEAEHLLKLVHTSDKTVRTVRTYFEKHLHKKISLDALAQKVCLSPSGLIHHFKKHTGKTPMAYLEDMRFAKAQTLLSTTDFSVTHIAARCGYENPYYFSNVFKSKAGVAPRDYRKNRGI